MLENGGTLNFPPGMTCTTEHAFSIMTKGDGVRCAPLSFGPYPLGQRLVEAEAEVEHAE